MTNKKTGRLAISVCMMVKNEEGNLTRCLESVKQIATEIIVVDTGSTDKTVAIAESYAAKVYHHPWENNFSKHRNQSIGYATGDWLFIIDADEEFCVTDDILEKFLKSLFLIPKKFNAVAIVMNDIQQSQQVLSYNTTRFFRNGKIKYDGTIHNQPVVEGAEGSILIDGPVLKHYGYDLNPEQREAKTERTSSLLLKRLDDNPKDYHAVFYLNQLYAANMDFDNALPYGEEYIKHRKELKQSGHGNFNTSIYFTMMQSYMQLNRMEDAERWLHHALQDIPEDIDIVFTITEMGVKIGRMDLVMLGATKFVQQYDLYLKNPSLKENRFTYHINPQSLSYCLFQLIQAYLSEGTRLIDVLKNALIETQSSYHDGMLADLKILLETYGLHNIAKEAVDMSALTNINPIFKKELDQNPGALS